MTNGNPTDTNQASELFELCKEVYERTGWLGTLQVIWNDQITVVDAGVEKWAQESKYINYAPLYTSDYLLEKLPRELDYNMCLRVGIYNGHWSALYESADDYSYDCDADTPLKALLKLTIALSEAGELK